MIFNNQFSDKPAICAEFGIDDFDGTVIFADYEYENYEGSAVVIFANEGKLFMVTGGHCSCHGLSEAGGWSPDEITVDQLKHIAANGHGKDQEASKQALMIMEKFGNIEDPDALAAAVTLYFSGRTH